LRAVNDEQVARKQWFARDLYGAQISTRRLSRHNIVISICLSGEAYVCLQRKLRRSSDLHALDTRERIYQVIPVIYFVGIEKRSWNISIL